MVWIHRVQIPLKTLALQSLPYGPLLRHVPEVHTQVPRRERVEEMTELVRPDFEDASVVAQQRVARVVVEAVRRLGAEHVTHVRARDHLQGAAALPDLMMRDNLQK